MKPSAADPAAPLPPSAGTRGLVVVIDDDADILDAFGSLLVFEGFRCLTFASASAYLADLQNSPLQHTGPLCFLCDVKMPNIDGLELQQRINAVTPSAPLIMMSGLSGAQETVSAFRAGAFDFLLKPIDANQLVSTLERALHANMSRQTNDAERDIAQRKLALLTEREMAVATMVARGITNLGISLELGISVRTVKFHRQRLLEKLEVSGATQLVRILDKA